MRRVTYKLQKVRGEYHVMLNFNHDNGRFRKALGLKIGLDLWSKDRQRVKGDYLNSFEINRMLDLYEKKIMDCYYKAVNDGVRLTPRIITEAIAPGLEAKKEKAIDFKAFFGKVIKDRAAEGTYSKHTIKHYQSCLRVLEDYEHNRRDEIHFDTIDTVFLEDFRSFLTHTRKLSANSISKHFRVLNTILSVAIKKKIPVKEDFKAFRIPEIESNNIYLSLDELKALNKYKYGVKLRNAIDIFLIGCFTALRYSDFSKVSTDHIRKVRGVEMIYLKQQKTGDNVVIPLHPIVRKILKRNGGMPHMISSQKLNDYIKEACKLVGITQPIVHYYNKAGKNLSKVVQKWELVASHTARRSCATNMMISGIDTKLIMRLTGHKKESNLMKYLCLDNEEAALLLSKSGFFS